MNENQKERLDELYAEEQDLLGKIYNLEMTEEPLDQEDIDDLDSFRRQLENVQYQLFAAHFG